MTRMGATGPQLHPIGLGAMGLSGVSYGPVDEATAVATVHAALDAGVTHIDTADVYGPDGHNERLVGRAIAGRRDQVFLATKFGFLGAGVDLRVDGRPERVAPCVQASLDRLGTDVIDLLYLHRIDPDVPVEESVGAMALQVQAGRVRHLGLSEASAATVRRAHAVHPITAVQSEYSLWWRAPEQALLPTLRELGIALVAFSPVARGLLAGALTGAADLGDGDVRRALPRFQGDNLDANLRLARVVGGIAERLGVTPGQLALAWVVREGMVHAIPGVRSPARIRENAAAGAIVLPPEVLRELDAAFTQDAAVGPRYPSSLERFIDP